MQPNARGRRRRLISRVMETLTFLATLLAVVPLGSILWWVASRGFRGLSLSFLLTPASAGPGIANAIVGSLILIGLATLIGVPVGVMAGIYLNEFPDRRLAGVVRFVSDVLTGLPSIVVGIFVYGLVVLTTRQFSAWAGSLALAIILIPNVTRTTEEMLRLVPHALREGALALGLPRWKVILRVVLPTAASGIITGVVLGLARIAGETAPLLFTAMYSRYLTVNPNEMIGSLPILIYNYAISPYDELNQQAWSAALVLILMILTLNILARLVVNRRAKAR